MFAAQPAKEKRSLLNFLLSNSTWAAGKLTVEFKEPFDILAEMVEAAARVEAAQRADAAKTAVWLKFIKSYRTFCYHPDPDIRFLFDQLQNFPITT
ncbi:MAG TPA: hypothetical protein VHE81_09390 [Lacipirellulaceae bacterium]|nr:hypothetical protein [Lacipirellulaceae bacterium]